MARKKAPEPEQSESTDDGILELPDGRRLQAAVIVSEPEDAAEASTDTVQELLAGNYSESIVDEVRRYGKPQWEKTESGLDPIDDIETFYDYDFKLPPHVHDAYVEAAQDEILSLEAMKAPTDPALQAQIEQRKQLVEGRHADDVRWMKHKAYYRGVQQVRAAKKQLEQLAAELSDEEAAEAAAAAAAAKGTKHQQPQQPYTQKLSLYSEDEVLAAISDPSEWETGWTAASYQQHPEVLQQLRSTFASSFGLNYVSPQEQQERDELWQQLLAAEAAAQQEAAQLEAARQEFLAKHTPYQAYTPQYLERQRQQQQLDAHRRHKQQAFWLSLGLAVGSSMVRWWHHRAAKKQQQQQRRRSGSQAGGSSRRSTRPPTPLMLLPEAIAE